ncbi:MAG: ATP-dependent RNA helicase [Spirochaetota bacterium]
MDYQKLPVYLHRGEIIAALEKNQVIIVESPTGSGKTTQLPLILHESGYTQRGMIGITQPRRIATLSVCDFISRQLHVPLGGFIGYKMRFEDVTSAETRIKIMTDGTLLQELKSDPLLLRYSVIMVDEAHERSLTIDFILGLLKDVIAKRPDFRLLVSSATIRTELFSAYFFQAPIISIAAKSFPVQVIYRSLGSSLESKVNKRKRAARKTSHPSHSANPADELAMKIRDLVVQLVLRESDTHTQSNGDILIFLPGEAHIKACLNILLPSENEYGLFVLPLYARLGKEEQQRIFDEAPYSESCRRSSRKVILATNIAETSLTIEGVTVVIDSGLAKLSHFDSYSQHAELREGRISKASAEQRKGRAGRIAPGLCYRLYSRAEYQAMNAFTQEEIQRTDLTEVILRMAELGIQDFENFDFLTAPEIDDIRNATASLIQLGALSDRKLTEIGKQMCYFPLLPRHSRILIEAIRTGGPECIHPVCVLTAFLSSNSPFLLPRGQEREAREAQSGFMGKYGDFEFYLQIFSQYKAMRNLYEKQQFCERYFLDAQVMYELQRITEQLKDIIRNCPPFAGIPIADESPPIHRYYEKYIQACLAGLQTNLCVQEENDSRNNRRKARYRSLAARNIIIHPGSSLFQKSPKYLLAGEIIRTSQVYARSASVLEGEWIRNFDPDLLKKLQELSRDKPDVKTKRPARSPRKRPLQEAQGLKKVRGRKQRNGGKSSSN